MQSFIKIGGAVLDKNCNKTMILCNFNKDLEGRGTEWDIYEFLQFLKAEIQQIDHFQSP